MVTLFATDYKTIELIYAYNEFELKIKVDIPENTHYEDIMNHYGDCYISDKYVYVKYDDKYIRIPFSSITYIKNEEMDHDVIYNSDLNKSNNHFMFYEMLVAKYNVNDHVYFENTAYTLK